MRWFVPTLLLALSCNPFKVDNSLVEEGNQAYESGEFENAQARYEETELDLPEVHFNKGTALLAKGEFQEAIKALALALDDAPDSLKPRILANLGLARLKLAEPLEGEEKTKMLHEAREALEMAVTLDPGYEPASRNLELVLFQLFPPCRVRDDEFEQNDTPEQSKPLADTAGKTLVLCPGNRDYFSIDMKEGERLSVDLTQPENPKGPLPTLSFTDSKGEAKAKAKTEKKGSKLQTAAPHAGTWHVRLAEDDWKESNYNLSYTTLPSCESMPDPYEDNDTPDQAKPFDPKQPEFRVCPGDDDWFRVDLAQFESLFVTASTKPYVGDIEVTIHGPDGHPVATGVPAPPPPGSADAKPDFNTLVALVLDVRTPGPYWIHVAGIDPQSEVGVKLDMKRQKPCPEGDDQFEDNDTAQDASVLEPPQQQPTNGQAAQQPDAPIQEALRRCPGDDDWFVVKVEPDKPMTVQIAFDHSKGDLKLEAYKDGESEAAAVSDQSSAEQSGEGLMLSAKEPTTYRVRITGGDATTNFYQLTVAPPKGSPSDQQDKDKQKQDQDKQKQDQDKQKQDQDKDKQKQDKQKQDQDKQKQDQDKQKQDQDKQKQDQDKQKQEKKKPEEEKKPPKQAMEQMMEQLDQEKRPNLEAERMLRKNPKLVAPNGKIW